MARTLPVLLGSAVLFASLRLPEGSRTWQSESREAAGHASSLEGGLLPKINERIWEGWEPPEGFQAEFNSWPDKPVPDEVMVWCKGFIPQNATTGRVGGYPVVPITGPMNVPIPGLLGKCAATDGRDWSSARPTSLRPEDARFWGIFSVANGKGRGVFSRANCGESHTLCCHEDGCFDGSKYGEVTCSEHCPDSEMQILHQACWPLTSTSHLGAGPWYEGGQECKSVERVAAARLYIKGRGGNPCGEAMGVSAPPASWDVGVAIFPTKRKVTITGFVDDAPSYECYAQARDGMQWAPPVTLARIPMGLEHNIAIELAGFATRPVNSAGLYFDVP